MTHLTLIAGLNSKYSQFYEKNKMPKTIKYKGNLSTKLLFPQKDENALTTLLLSADDIFWSPRQLHISYLHTIIYTYFAHPIDFFSSQILQKLRIYHAWFLWKSDSVDSFSHHFVAIDK